MSRRGRSVLSEAALVDALRAAREAVGHAGAEDRAPPSPAVAPRPAHRWPIYRCGLHPLGGSETCAVGPSSGRCRHGLCPGASSFLPISARCPEPSPSAPERQLQGASTSSLTELPEEGGAVELETASSAG